MDATTRRRSTGLGKSCILIIVVASLERFAWKGVASNLVTYLTEELKMGTSMAAKNVNSWNGVTSMLPLVGAFLTDSFWDRYSTIMSSSLLYVVGLVGLTSWSLLCNLLCTWVPTTSLFLPLYLISVAQGGYSPSLQAFGADQLDMDEELPESTKDKGKPDKKSLFFQWWYFGICSGSLLGNSLLSYIQDTYGWHLGFGIPTIAMAVSVALFTVGSKFYVHKDSKAMTRSVRDVIEVFKASVIRTTYGRWIKVPLEEPKEPEIELQGNSLQDDFNGLLLSCKDTSSETAPPNFTKVILRLLPIWSMLLMFAVIFQQPLTFFTKQGMVMRRNIGRHFVIPPAALQSAITISIILLMPLYDKLIIPFIQMITRKDKGIDVYQRIGIGMILSIIAMVVAAVVEAKRVEVMKTVDGQLSIFWLLPQYVLLGISDVFTVVGMQEFFYTQVPVSMRTIGIALYTSVFGVGSFLGAFLISAIEFITSVHGNNSSWFSDDMEEAQLYKYYWFLVFLSTFSFFMFMHICRYYDDRDLLENGGGK